MRFTKRATLVAFMCCGSTLASGAHAQSESSQASESAASATPADEGDQDIREIVVTAQRRSQNLQSVPVAVTALDSEALQTHVIRDVEDVQFLVPSMRIRQETAVNGFSVAMRGISVSADNFAFDSPVGVYINEVFIARSNDFGAAFFDVQNVQVLRGPQGTFFGRNTPIGAVLIETTRPGSSYGGYVKATVGGGGYGIGDGADRTFYQFEGAVDLPVSPILNVRLAGYYVNDDGWARSRFTGYKNHSKDDVGGRATFVLTPSDDFKATLILDHNRTNQGIPIRIPVEAAANMTRQNYDALFGGNAATDAVRALALHPDPYANDSDFTNQRAEGKSNSATLHLDLDLSEDWTLRSISGWRHIRRSSRNDNDGTAFVSNFTTADIGQTQVSQEFVVNGDFAERFHFVGGLFYFKETGFDENLTSSIRNPNLPTAFLDPLLLRGEDIENVSKAAFTNLSFDILENLAISGGIRYTKENKAVTLAGRSIVSGTPFSSGRETFEDSVVLYDTKLTWQANDDLLAYVKYGTGYRAGGIGFRAADAQFQPELSKTYEAGLKWDFDMGSVPARLNTAVFQTKYQDFQVNVVLSNPTRQTVINAGSATIRGVELEFSAKPVEGLDIGVTASFIDPKYDGFVFSSPSFGGLIDLTGNKLRDAPKQAIAVTVGYTVPSSIGDFLLQADYAYSSSYEADAIFQRGAPAIVRTSAFFQDATHVVNARISLAKAFGSNIELAVWGKNLTDQKRIIYGLNSSGLRAVSYSEPLSFGFELRANF